LPKTKTYSIISKMTIERTPQFICGRYSLYAQPLRVQIKNTGPADGKMRLHNFVGGFTRWQTSAKVGLPTTSDSPAPYFSHPYLSNAFVAGCEALKDGYPIDFADLKHLQEIMKRVEHCREEINDAELIEIRYKGYLHTNLRKL